MPSNFYDPLDMDEYIPSGYVNSLFSGAPEIDFLGAVQKTQERNLLEEKIAREQETLQRKETQDQKIAELFSSGQEVTPVELQKIYLETGDIQKAYENQKSIASQRVDKEKQAREHMNMALKFAKDGDPDFAKAYMDAQGLSDSLLPDFGKIDAKGRKKGGGSGGSSSGGVGKVFYNYKTGEETSVPSKNIQEQNRLQKSGWTTRAPKYDDDGNIVNKFKKKEKETPKKEESSEPGYFEKALQMITGASNSLTKKAPPKKLPGETKEQYLKRVRSS